MADIKKLQTRIALKYDSYANWTDESKEGLGANLVLLKGELGICAIEDKAQGAQTAPTVLFKVGDGTTPFKSLKWASALAADVYSWAKASDVVLEGKVIKFVGSDKTVTLNYATPEEVAAAVKVVSDDLGLLTARVADVEAKFTGEGSVSSLISAAKQEAIAAAADDATSKANAAQAAAEATAAACATSKANAAEAAAKSYVDGKVTDLTKKDGELVAEDARLAGLISDNADAIDAVEEDLAQELLDRAAADQAIEAKIGTVADGKTVVGLITEAQTAAEANAASDAAAKVKGLADGKVAENTAAIAANAGEISKNASAIAANTKAVEDEAAERAAADTLINEKFGAEYSKTATVAAAIADAKKAGTDANTAVDNLSKGQVATNKADIAQLRTDLTEEARLRAEEDNKLDARLDAVEAFFVTAEGETIDKALDTLVEIQDYLNGDGSATGGIIERVAQAESDIDALEKTLAKDGDFEKRVAAVEAKASANEGDIADLETLTAGFAAGETIKAKIEAAAQLGQTGIDNAATAQAAAEAADGKAVKAQEEVDALEKVVEGVKSTADTAAADLAALTGEGGRIAVIEGDIDDLQADSHTHANKSELDLITSGDKAKWDDAYSKRHTHSFVETELNNIKSGDVAKWNTAATTAGQAAADLAALTAENGRIATAESDIDALEAIVKTGANTNAQLRSDITELQGIVKTGADANATLGGEIDALAAKVNNETTGLAATKDIADKNKTDIGTLNGKVAAIESDYLKMADLFIIDCGTSTTVVHTMPNN